MPRADVVVAAGPSLVYYYYYVVECGAAQGQHGQVVDKL